MNFDTFLYHYNCRRGNDDELRCTNRKGYYTGEEQPYLTWHSAKTISDSFDKLTYKQKKEITDYNKNKEKN